MHGQLYSRQILSVGRISVDSLAAWLAACLVGQLVCPSRLRAPVWVKRLLPHRTKGYAGHVLEQAVRLVAWMAAVQLIVIAGEWMIQIHKWVSVQVQTLQSSVQENRTNSGHYLQLETESGICRPACCVV
jgi:hypothetical protein